MIATLARHASETRDEFAAVANHRDREQYQPENAADDAEVIQHQMYRGLMRGKNAALHSRHLFSGFLRCGICGGAITVVSGGRGTPRYGCLRHSKNGDSACTNRLTIRAKIADGVLLEGLQAELLRPTTVAFITDRLTGALNELADQ
jgi:hypothetical protein